MKKAALLMFIVLCLLLLPLWCANADDTQEDCVGFNPDKIEVENVGGRWRIVDDAHMIMDFGSEESEARIALKIIQKYGYDHICFVGRPDPSMTYFTVKERPPKVTTVVVVRHAERANDSLTEEGEKRAEALANILSESEVAAVFSTTFTRTRETVNNTAVQVGVPVQYYQSASELTRRIKEEYAGEVVLVASHKGLGPDAVRTILYELGVKEPVPSIDKEYNNLFIATVMPSGVASLTHLKYEIHRDID